MLEGMANLMVFFGGALSYTELENMPVPRMMKMHREKARIAQVRKVQVEA